MLATVSGALVRQTCAKKRFRCLSVASCSPSGGWSAVELRKARRAAKFSLELILRRKWGFPARCAIRPDCGIGFARRQASRPIDIRGCVHAGWRARRICAGWNIRCRMTSAAIALFALLLVKHFVCDFVLQTKWQMLRRASTARPGGLVHSGIHVAGTLLALIAVMTPVTTVVHGSDRRIHRPLPH